MIQALVKKGIVIGEQVPAPLVSKGAVLIKVVNSCISAGTETSAVKASGKSLIKRALEQPEKVKKVIDMVRSDGVAIAYKNVMGELETGRPTGYSLSGVVIGIGEQVTEFEIGDRVAAAGGGVASHAEYVDVPVNLVVKMPPEVDFIAGSSVALGAIAMQGVRRADLKLGEFGVVIGTGLLGLLTVQMLRSSGVRVAALDIDSSRLEMAKTLGAELVLNPLEDDPVKKITAWSGGYGADAVLFTAATASNEPLSQAFQMCRRKGRVILVGTSGMEIKRSDIYTKELDFLISTSYGPGRYDKNYEEKGCDYPYPYVRWTEQRNMAEYLRLIQSGDLNVTRLVSDVYPIEKVTAAFRRLKNPADKPLMVILDYGEPDSDKLALYKNHDRKIIINQKLVTKDVINIALVGVGNFAMAMHLPNIRKLSGKYRLYAVMDKLGHKAKNIATQFDCSFATSNYDDVLSDSNIDIVFICTRHDSHAELVLKALQAGKHVFVEKPLATDPTDLKKIEKFYDDEQITKKPVLMVGFNRRFSRYAAEIKKHTDKRVNPLFIHYRMNAGFIPLDHWVHENGGRMVGEACHIIDLMTYFTGARIKNVSFESLTPNNEAISKSDNKSFILKYDDGSVATIEYFAVGSKQFPKEYLEIHFDEKTIVMEDYRSLKGFGLKLNELTTAKSEKGQFEELIRLHDTLTGKNTKFPIEIWDLIQTTRVTFLLSGQQT